MLDRYEDTLPFDQWKELRLRAPSAKVAFTSPDAVTPDAARPWDRDEIAKLKALREAGWNASNTAKRLPGRTLDAIVDKARKIGLPFGTSVTWTASEEAKFLVGFRAGLSPEEIATRIPRSPSAIRTYASKRGFCFLGRCVIPGSRAEAMVRAAS